jgi:hypothetical protein
LANGGGFFFLGPAQQSNTYIGIAVKKTKKPLTYNNLLQASTVFFFSLFIRQLRGSEQKDIFRERKRRESFSKMMKNQQCPK